MKVPKRKETRPLKRGRILEEARVQKDKGARANPRVEETRGAQVPRAGKRQGERLSPTAKGTIPVATPVNHRSHTGGLNKSQEE